MAKTIDNYYAHDLLGRCDDAASRIQRTYRSRLAKTNPKYSFADVVDRKREAMSGSDGDTVTESDVGDEETEDDEEKKGVWTSFLLSTFFVLCTFSAYLFSKILGCLSLGGGDEQDDVVAGVNVMGGQGGTEAAAALVA